MGPMSIMPLCPGSRHPAGGEPTGSPVGARSCSDASPCGSSGAAVDLDPPRPLITEFLTAAVSWRSAEDRDPRSAAVDADWEQRVARAPHLWRGEILDVVAAERRDAHIEFTIRPSDFARYLFERDGEARSPLVHVLYASALVTTGEGSLVLVQSSAKSAAPGMLGLPGGNVDIDDVRRCSEEDFVFAAEREAAEELGITDIRRDADLSLLMTTGARASVGVIVPLCTRAKDAEVLRAVDETSSPEIARAHLVATSTFGPSILEPAPVHSHLETVIEWWKKAKR